MGGAGHRDVHRQGVTRGRFGLSAAAIHAAAGGAATCVYALRLSTLLDAIVLVVIAGAATVALSIGAARRRGMRRLPWAFLATCQLLWTAGWVLWEAHVVRVGAAPAPGSISDLLFLAGDCFLVGALALLFRANT